MIESLIKEIYDHLNDTDDLSVLSDWNMRLSAEFGLIASELANIKRDRAKDELDIKLKFIASGDKYTEKGIERAYFSTDRGQYYTWSTEMLRAVSKLISAIRFKIRMLSEPLN